MKEELISKIRTIAESEKFKQDAFFLCGSSTGNPNFTLLEACERYLETVDAPEPDVEAAEKLISELEAVAAIEQDETKINRVVTNVEYVKEILANKSLLLDK